MTNKNSRSLWGAVLIVLGFFFLLQNFHLLGSLGNLVSVGMFGLLGI